MCVGSAPVTKNDSDYFVPPSSYVGLLLTCEPQRVDHTVRVSVLFYALRADFAALGGIHQRVNEERLRAEK